VNNFLSKVRQILIGTDIDFLSEVNEDGTVTLLLYSKKSGKASDLIQLADDAETAVFAVLEFVAQLRKQSPEYKPPDESKSWVEFAAKISERAKAAGGSIEAYRHYSGKLMMRYFRLARLKHNTVFSPLLLRQPYHSGQNHIFHFTMPDDYDVLGNFLDYDTKLYCALIQAETE